MAVAGTVVLGRVTDDVFVPAFKGHRDDAYLSLWRIKLDDKSSARLAEARSSAPYKSEHQHALRPAAPASDAATKTLERQCKGLWGELQRNAKPAR